MKLAVSHIAWDNAENDSVARMLTTRGVTGVELAPTKWREDAFTASAADVESLRCYWNDRGLDIVSLQSLLFGRPELQLFGDAESRLALADTLRRAIDFAHRLGATSLVFGSPKNRTRGSLSNETANAIAVDFFQSIGEYAASRGCRVCIEPNPEAYGCDFLTTTPMAIDFCRAVANPGIALNLDLGTIAMNGESPSSVIESAGSLIGHVHVSEPNLVEPVRSSIHDEAGGALGRIGYQRWVSIEMRAAGAGKNRDAVERAVSVAGEAYGQLRAR